MNFRELIEIKNREEAEANAYLVGADDYVDGRAYLNPFVVGTSAFRDYDNGYKDAYFLSTLERFEDRVAA